MSSKAFQQVDARARPRRPDRDGGDRVRLTDEELKQNHTATEVARLNPPPYDPVAAFTPSLEVAPGPYVCLVRADAPAGSG